MANVPAIRSQITTAAIYSIIHILPITRVRNIAFCIVETVNILCMIAVIDNNTTTMTVVVEEVEEVEEEVVVVVVVVVVPAVEAVVVMMIIMMIL